MTESVKIIIPQVPSPGHSLENIGSIRLAYLHRYFLAQQLSQERTVLDLVCDDGYGSSLLASVAKHVIGVIQSPEVMQYAGKKYLRENLEYRAWDGTAIPLPDNSLDMVVHLASVERQVNCQSMMAEYKRVLTSGGVLIISSPPSKHENEHYHNELVTLLSTNFKQVAIFDQKMVCGSGIFPENCSGAFVSCSVTDRNSERMKSTPGLLKPLCVLAVASDIALPPMACSFLQQPDLECDTVQHGTTLNLSVAAHAPSEVAPDNELLKEKQFASLKQLLQKSEEQRAHLQQLLDEKKAQLAELFSSKSWRLTEPFRFLRRYVMPNKLERISENNAVVELTGPSIKIDNVPEESSRLPEGCDFDAEFYQKAYPHSHGLDPYYHYMQYGKSEGCLPCRPQLTELDGLKSKLDHSKSSVLVVSHDASRTGAPILSLNIVQQLKKKYNVIVWLLGGGDLVSEFARHSDLVISLSQTRSSLLYSCVLERLVDEVQIKFAIVNSIVSSSVLPPLAYHFIPSLLLVHEFASYIRPHNVIPDAILWASEVVFSASIVHKSYVAQYAAMQEQHVLILPQGKCSVPHDQGFQGDLEFERQKLLKLFRPKHLPADAVVILGAGVVEMRKGVDLFLACAARVARLHPANAFRFIWVGHGYDPEKDTTYSAYLQDQIQRAGLESLVCFAGEVGAIEEAYQLSDILFLSSRLDPLPNVAIDAMLLRLPVICFEETTGIADLLKDNGFGGDCVVPYLDVELAAQKIARLIDEKEKRIQLGADIKNLAVQMFNMEAYVNALDLQALGCTALQEIEKHNCLVIAETGALQLDYYSSPMWPAMTSRQAIRAFVRTWQVGLQLRKPFPGFHPGIYKDLHGISVLGMNPLADFILNNKPEGEWLSELIQPQSSLPVRFANTSGLRMALHVHVFFVDLFQDLFARIEAQHLPLHLLISVPSQETAERVASIVSGYAGGDVDIRIVPNRGRDIGAFLSEFASTILQCYDIIGHVHTKKSEDLHDSAVGQIWANFLLENLIGGKFPMASIILERMAENEKLGLVFPEDPYIVGWTANKQIATDLAQQLKIDGLPENNFNFPVDSMFWARTEALKPLLMKNFSWEDYPEEPLPYDGSMLHAIERLWPFVAQKMDYRVAMTYVPGLTR